MARISPALLALVAYGCLSAAIFGRQALGDLPHVVVGFGSTRAFYGHDQGAYVWFLAWAARALTHLQNPLFTTEVFAQQGYNLTWASSILGVGLIVAPITLVFGAIPSYDLLAIAAPAGAAWTSFLLCRHVTACLPAAFAGGLLFGFGTYEAAETINHLNLALVGLLPLAALLVLRRWDGMTSRARFVAALGIVLALQLWTSSEVFASTVVFGAVGLVLAALLGGRSRLRHAGPIMMESLAGLLVAAVLGAPYLYYALAYRNPVGGLPGGAGVDLYNFVVPTQVTWLQGDSGVARLARGFRGNITEQLGYVGLPLLVMLSLFAVGFRRRLEGRLVLIFMVIVWGASLGSHLVVGGRVTRHVLPWNLVNHLPLLRFATASRFVVYLWLAVAVAAALWLAQPTYRRWRWVLFGLVVVSLAPNMTGVPWGTRVDSPPLLANSALARYVPTGSTVLALPFGIAGNSMFWQVQADFRFRLAGGYVSLALPPQYQTHRSFVRDLIKGTPPAGHAREQLCAFIRLTQSNVILLRDHTRGSWSALLDPLRIRQQHAGGFSVYELTDVFQPGRACASPKR